MGGIGAMNITESPTVRFVSGPTIMLANGTYFDFLNPEGAVFGIDEIAFALSNLCRFNGHCSSFYSVAQHSVLVSNIVPVRDSFAGLMHDAAEAFVGDMCKPLKCLIQDFGVIEKRVESVVFSRFGLPSQLPESVKLADRRALRTEQRDLMGAGDHVWQFTEGADPVPGRIVPLGPEDARQLFLRRFQELAAPDPNGMEL